MVNEKPEIKRTFQKAIDRLSNNYRGNSLTDIFVIIDEEIGELSIYDDEENLLVKEIIGSWVRTSYEDSFDYAAALKEVVENMHEEKLFSSLDIYTPFSINLADEEFIVQEELLLIQDDSMIRIEDEFMKRMDKEFDEFLDKLLKE